MRIIIDGYNVIGVLHNDMEKIRNSFIELLIKYKNLKHHDITVVFDAYKSGDKYEQTAFSGGVKIIYTKLGETADDMIKRIISHEQREWVVISTDKDLTKYTWSVNSVPVPSSFFLDILEIGMQPKRLNGEDEDDTVEIKPLKGSPFRLSRKDKALKRVIGKL